MICKSMIYMIYKIYDIHELFIKDIYVSPYTG